MNDYHIEQNRSMPRYNTFVSHLRAFPFAISFPERVTAIPVPFAPDRSLCVNFKKPNTQPSVAVTRWVLEWNDNFILYNDFLEGREDLVWLAKRNMDDGKGKPYYPWGQYEFAEKTGGIFPKPKTSSISPALSRVVRVTYQEPDKQRQGQRIFCQRPGDPRNIFWTILLEPDAEVTDSEFEHMLLSLRWL
jgi:hypothetical protein